MRRIACALTVIGTLIAPSSAFATTTAIAASVNFGSAFICLDVTVATANATGTLVASDGTVLGTLIPQAPVATNCAGGAGRSIRLLEPTPRVTLEGSTVRVKGSDDGSEFTFRVPISRADPTSGAGVTHVQALPPASTVNGVATVGPTTDIAGTPAVAIVMPAGGVNATIAVLPSRTYFFASSQQYGTFVQLNDPAPGVPVTIELRQPDGSLIASRTVPVGIDGRTGNTQFDQAPVPGGTVRVAQAGALDRARVFGDVAITADGFRVALPPAPGCVAATCPDGRFFTNLALHGESSTVTDPLGPCRQLAYTGALPSACTPLTTPRSSVTATGLLPVGGDSIELDTSWPVGDRTSLSAVQRGASADLDYGFVTIGGLAPGPLTGTATIPRATGGPLVLARTLGGDSISEGGLSFEGSTGFSAHLSSGTTAVFNGPALGTAPLSASFTLTAAVEGADLVGRAAPNARIRIRRTPPVGPAPDVAGSAGADGSYRISLGATVTDTLLSLSAGDPATRAATSAALVVGRAHLAIAGVSDRQLVRGAITATATGDTTGPVRWRVGAIDSNATAAPWARAIDTRTFADGPLKLRASDSRLTDYVYVIVDNAVPSGGAGPDQSAKPRRNALIITDASDANGLASVTATFGDGSTLAQPASQLGQPLTHAYAKVGTFKVTITITDAAGNVATDTATVRVRSGVAPRVSGAVPLSAVREKGVRFTLRASAAGSLTVRLVNGRGRVVRTAVKRAAKAGGKVSFAIAARRLSRGRYVLVRQLVSDDGTPGAIATSGLLLR